MAEPYHTALIPLSQGKFAIVDFDDYAVLSQYKWHAQHYGYAIRFASAGETGSGYIKKAIWMHRVILGAPDGVPVDHRNGRKNDNRRSNLRLCTHAENCRNKSAKGVGFHKASGRWRAYIRFNYKQIERHFNSYEEAVVGREVLKAEYFGEFAKQY